MIDRRHFIDCTLLNCTLEYSGGPVILERTQLSGCRYVFFEQAGMTVQLVQTLGLMFSGDCEAGVPELVQ